MPETTPPSATPTLTTALVARRLFLIAWERKGQVLGLLLMQGLMLTLTLGGLGLLGLGVDVLARTLEPMHAVKWPLGLRPPDAWPLFDQALAICCAIIVVGILRWLIESRLLAQKGAMVARLQSHLRTQVYDRLQRLSFRFFDKQASGSLINRVTYDVFQLRMFIDGVLLESLNMTVTLVFFLGSMFLLDWRLACACLLPVPLVLWATMRFSKNVKPAYKKNSELLDEAIRILAENAQGVHVVKGFGMQERERKKFQDASDEVAKHAGWLTRRVAVFTPMAEFLTQLPIIILFFYGGWIYCHDEPGHPRLALGTGLLFFYGLLKRFSNQIGVMAQIAGTVQQSINGARRVFEVLDEPARISSKPGAPKTGRLRGEINFDNVSFGHTPGKPALSGVSLAIPAGTRVAILGPTGAGKSTLLSLVSRFHDPDSGTVSMDGTDARELDLDGLRRNIGVVFQETFLFSNTIASNIAFGKPDATLAEIRQAAAIAHADGFIMEMEKGYDTVLSEGGNGLSGGQRQRIALARALLTDPAILILDDPTASIDPDTEREIMAALEGAMRGRTVIFVAHRMQTLRQAGRVVVLEEGRITASGTHDELMAQSGHYREVAFAQAGNT